MTTLVAVRKNDEIAIAADSLTTFGDTRLSAEYDRTSEKIVHYQGTHIGLCGSAAHQLVFESLLAAHGHLDFSTKAAIFETFRKLHPILKEQHFLNPKEEEDDPYESTQVTALVANEHGIFGVYSMREVFEYTRFWAVGSGREFALGAMHAEYPLPVSSTLPWNTFAGISGWQYCLSILSESQLEVEVRKSMVNYDF